MVAIVKCGCGKLRSSIEEKRSAGAGLQETSLLNYIIKDGTLTPTYRKPFDLIVEGLKNEEWGPWADDLRTFLTLPEAKLAADRMPLLTA